jgi:predicted RNA-binding protein YlqC (UPF0109 family)
MEEILKLIITSLVDNKEAVEIEKTEKGDKEVYQVKVDSSEMGKVIGKQGKIAHSIRTIAKSVGMAKENKRVEVEFVD